MPNFVCSHEPCYWSYWIFHLLNTTYMSLVLFYLFIAPPIHTNGSSDRQFLREGKNLQLFCIASGRPAPNITWVKITSSGSESDVLHRGTTWDLKNINRTEAGTYCCTANTEWSGKSSEPYITSLCRMWVYVIFFSYSICISDWPLISLEFRNFNLEISWNTLKAVGIGKCW